MSYYESTTTETIVVSGNITFKVSSDPFSDGVTVTSSRNDGDDDYDVYELRDLRSAIDRVIELVEKNN